MVLDPEVAALIGLEQFPCIGGHEGAGEVIEVGPGVTSVAVGDPVVLGFIPSCGRCPSFARRRQPICRYDAFLLAARQVSDLPPRPPPTNAADLAPSSSAGTPPPPLLS